MKLLISKMENKSDLNTLHYLTRKEGNLLLYEYEKREYDVNMEDVGEPFDLEKGFIKYRDYIYAMSSINRIDLNEAQKFLINDVNNVIALESRDGLIYYHNMYISSYSLKYDPQRLRLERGYPMMGRIKVPFQDINEGEIELFVSKYHFYTDLPETEFITQEITKPELYLPNRLSISGPTEVDKDGVIELTVSIVDNQNNKILKEGIKVKAKSDKGHLPVRRELTNSQGEVKLKFVPEYLDSGEICTVKVGFDFYSNIKEHQIIVR